MESWSAHLKQVEGELATLDAIPQLGSLPPFPYEALAEALNSQLNISLNLEETGSRWGDRQEALADLGDPLTQLTFSAPPFEGEAHFVLPTRDLQRLMQRLLGGDPYSAALYDSDLREGFLEFLTSQVLSAIESLDYPLTPTLVAKAPLPNGPLFIKELTLGECHARLLLSPSLIHSIRARYDEMKVPLTPEFAATLTLRLSVEVGQTELSGEEWRHLAAGDFVALDTCTFDPETCTGTVQLSLEGNPLFGGEVGPEGVTLTGPA
ncbi:MAG: hypothetical protein AB7F31_00700 [Parachlamydiales bacterium]